MDLSVIIVSYNTAVLLLEGLEALLQSLETSDLAYEVIVVDNASQDGSPQRLCAQFPQVCLIANESNRGFAAANNQGIRESTGRYLLFLNPDTKVLGNAPQKLVDFLEQHQKAGAVCGQILNPDGSFQHTAFRFPTLWMGFFEFFPVNHRVLDSRLNGRYPRRLYRQPFPVDHPLGACFLARRQAFEEVGLFDEDFFLYYEEIDWFWRLRQRGWSIYCVPDAKIIHHGAQSTRQHRQAAFVELHRNKLRFYRKHYSPFFCWLARWILRLGVLEYRASAWWQWRQGALSSEELQAWQKAYKELLRV